MEMGRDKIIFKRIAGREEVYDLFALTVEKLLFQEKIKKIKD